MKLLIVTQKVDHTDPILGFFHRWIQEFATQCEQVTVISQFVGEHQLPLNVTVHSLGKEKGKSRIRQIFRFWKLQKTLAQEYDTVLVHMTPIWVVLGARHWNKMSKPIYLWYEARGGGWALPRAIHAVRKVFSATAYGLPLESNRQVVLGHGIDTEQFCMPTATRDPQLIVAIGRMTRVKRYDLILKAFASLPSSSHLEVRGLTITQEDDQTLEEFQRLCDELALPDRVNEVHPAEHTQIPPLLQRASLLLHAGEGGLDKAILEAMSCGCLVVTSSKAAEGILPVECIASPDELGDKAKALLALTPEKQGRLRTQLRQIILDHHSLQSLVQKMVAHMSS